MSAEITRQIVEKKKKKENGEFMSGATSLLRLKYIELMIFNSKTIRHCIRRLLYTACFTIVLSCYINSLVIASHVR